MNRIYQGRVSKVEITDGEGGKPIALEKWEEKPWRHHDLFQDAVNYYTLALAAMSPDESSLPPAKRRMGRSREQRSHRDFRNREAEREWFVRRIKQRPESRRSSSSRSHRGFKNREPEKFSVSAFQRFSFSGIVRRPASPHHPNGAPEFQH